MEGMDPKASPKKQHLEPTWRKIVFGGGANMWCLGRRPFGSQLIREAALPGGEYQGTKYPGGGPGDETGFLQ